MYCIRPTSKSVSAPRRAYSHIPASRAKRTHEERKRGSIVTPTLGLKNVSNMGGDVLLGEFTLADDGRREDGVGRGDTGGNDESGEKFESRDDGVHERGRDHPA